MDMVLEAGKLVINIEEKPINFRTEYTEIKFWKDERGGITKKEISHFDLKGKCVGTVYQHSKYDLFYCRTEFVELSILNYKKQHMLPTGLTLVESTASYQSKVSHRSAATVYTEKDFIYTVFPASAGTELPYGYNLIYEDAHGTITLETLTEAEMLNKFGADVFGEIKKLLS